MKSIIIPYNKSKEVCDFTTTGVGVHEIRVAVEQPAAAFTFFIKSINADVQVSWRIYEVGDETKDKILLYRSDQFTKADILDQALVSCNGPLIVEVDHIGIVSYTIRAKAIDALPAPTETVAVNSADTVSWHRRMVDLLKENNLLLSKLLNNTRLLTDVEGEEGEEGEGY